MWFDWKPPSERKNFWCFFNWHRNVHKGYCYGCGQLITKKER